MNTETPRNTWNGSNTFVTNRTFRAHSSILISQTLLNTFGPMNNTNKNCSMRGKCQCINYYPAAVSSIFLGGFRTPTFMTKLTQQSTTNGHSVSKQRNTVCVSSDAPTLGLGACVRVCCDSIRLMNRKPFSAEFAAIRRSIGHRIEHNIHLILDA